MSKEVLEENADLVDALQFIENIDRLKTTYRKCLLMSGERHESTAEHCFSLAMAVLCLNRFSNNEIDINKTIKMALFHDLAEVLMGDTFHYDKKEGADVIKDEIDALQRVIKPIADAELGNDILDLWLEFESGDSREAIFLRGIDRFLPMFHNYKTNGHSWVKFGVSKEMALKKNVHIQDSSNELWKFTKAMVEESHAKGWLS